MLKETVELLYPQEDKRREDAFNKYKKSMVGQPLKKYQSKYDIPMEPVTVAFGQELFDGCIKKITKRIAAAKKTAKPNRDLKNVARASSMQTDMSATKTFGKTSGMGKMQSAAGATMASRMLANASPDLPIKPLGPPSTYNPILDPHHLQLV